MGAAPPLAVRAWATPDKFSGDRTSDWQTWLLQFGTIANANGWTQQQQATYIGLYLTGNAQSYYHSLPAAIRTGPLQPLLQALTDRFASPQQVDVYRAEFKARRQHPTETISDFCEAVRKLARYSYPNLAPNMQDLMAKDQFVTGLDSRDLRIRVRELDPQTLDDALRRALHSQAIADTESAVGAQPHAIPVHAVHAAASPDMSALFQRLDILGHSIQSLMRASVLSAAPPRPPSSDDLDIRCWNCNQLGHYRSRCPLPPPKRPGNQPQRPSGN